MTTDPRARFGFADLVAKHFAFLEPLGFARRRSSSTLVCYGKGNLELRVYHGRSSYEIGLEIDRGATWFTLSDLIRATDAAAADKYRNPAISRPEGMATGVARVAEVFQRYGQRALDDEPGFYDGLERQRRAWLENYALDVLAQQTRPKANAAFRAGRYAEAAELFEQIRARLGPAEQKKLEIARRRR